MTGSTPITLADRELLREVVAMPIEQRRSRQTIMAMRSRSWSWPTIAGLLQLPISDVMQIAEGTP